VYTATLSVKEGAKSNATGNMLRTATDNASTLKIKLEQPALNTPYHFLGEIRFSEEATDELDSQMDVPNKEGGIFSFGMPVGGESIISNQLSPLSGQKIVPLTVDVASSFGVYNFVFSGLGTFETGTQVYIRDMVMGTITNLNENPVYTFGVFNQTEANGNRFELIFTPNSVTSTIAVIKGLELNLFPNPASGSEVVFSLKGALRGKGQLVLNDLLGKEVLRQNLELEDGVNQKSINIEGMAAGVYTLKVVTPAATFSQKLVVK
jgi:hypothetical protein